MACGTCTVGDPTLTVFGSGQPTERRLRVSAVMRHRRELIGNKGVDRLELKEQRLEFGMAFSPTDWLTMSAMMPLVHRKIREVNLAQRRRWAAGDLELRARVRVYSDRRFAPRHLLSLIGGVEAPTSKSARDSAGENLPLEFQTGTGSWDAIIGASYNFFSDPWSIYLSTLGTFPTKGHGGAKGGNQIRVSSTLQWQPWTAFGFRGGAEFRAERATRENGTKDANSGGHIAYANVGLVALPHNKLTLHATVFVPVVERLRGSHNEFVSFNAGALYEF